MVSFIQHNGLLINRDFLAFLKAHRLADFQSLMDFNGGYLLKKKKFRSIVRIEKNGNIFYLKRHFRPWKERILSAGPWGLHEDARNEWKNIVLLNNLGFNTMCPVAFGEKKRFGMPYCSLTLTENIYDAEKLETYLPKQYRSPLSKEQVTGKRALIKRLAELARTFHGTGLNHQDFYLGHIFFRPKDNTLFLIDLQRMHQRNLTRRHDLIKDLAQLAYSARRSGIFTHTDFMRFALFYFDRDTLSKDDKKTIRKIISKVEKIARHDANLQMRKKESRPAR